MSRMLSLDSIASTRSWSSSLMTAPATNEQTGKTLGATPVARPCLQDPRQVFRGSDDTSLEALTPQSVVTTALLPHSLYVHRAQLHESINTSESTSRHVTHPPTRPSHESLHRRPNGEFTVSPYHTSMEAPGPPSSDVPWFRVRPPGTWTMQAESPHRTSNSLQKIEDVAAGFPGLATFSSTTVASVQVILRTRRSCDTS